jgi:SprT-like family
VVGRALRFPARRRAGVRTLSFLGKLFGRGLTPSPDVAQLALDFTAPAPSPTEAAAPTARRTALAIAAGELLERLRGLGLDGITALRLTRNRTVMVSFKGGELRVHEGFLHAPEAVHAAIVTFVRGRTRAQRQAAQAVILAHPVARPPVRRRKERGHAEDEPAAERLREWHARFNAMHFGGTLKPIAVRVSRRLESRLGHYTAAGGAGEMGEIVIGRRHVKRHGWSEALHTLLHEMVHQWQDETGLPVDHGRSFRQKARAVGITAAARRVVAPAPRESPALRAAARER